jgi:outer membrane autotransporter protein
LCSSPLLVALDTGLAQANCVHGPVNTACDSSAPNPFTAIIGSGNNASMDNRTVTIGNGAVVATGNANAISLRDNNTVTVQSGGTVRNAASGGGGGYGAGNNTIEFRNNGTLTVEQGGQVLSQGAAVNAEAVNLMGTGNTIINSGTIAATNAAAIWFESGTATNTIINNETGIIRAPGNVIGSSGNASVNFTNRGRVEGNLVFAGGNDTLRLFTGSVITGNIAGGAGNDRIFLDGTGTASIPGNLTGFEALTKSGSGTWTITGTISGPTVTAVEAGTLILTGNNTTYNGTMRVDPGATLEARAQSLPPSVTNNGLVRFTQPDNGTYTGPISGTGRVEKTGAGMLTLAPAAPGGNSYSGGTTISGGTIAITRDAAIGAATGGLTFNGGALRYDAAFDLAATRAIDITAAGGTIDTNGFSATISQGITGDGALTVDGPGNLILTGASTYAGGSTINAGANLQLGNGGTSGSIVGDVANNGTLIFNRSDTVTFAGAISGSGAVRHDGTGTTILTADNTYTGGTTISAGTLQLGNGGTTGSIQGDVLNNSLHSLVFNRSNTLVFSGIISGIGAVRQEGTGTTVLTGANTYSGPTAVNAGTLRAGGANVFSPASQMTVAAAGTLDLDGFDQTLPGLSNAGEVWLGTAANTTLTVAGNYVGQGGVVRLSTVLGSDGSASDRLAIDGGRASGNTSLLVTNVGGGGARTQGDGIRVVETANGGTTAADAFRLGGRVAAGAYEYQLFRGGYSGGSGEDWFLRNTLPVTPVESPAAGEAAAEVPQQIPLYRPEVALYAPVAGVARTLGAATIGRLGTLHERVGEQENLRDLGGRSPYANGAWARVFGERIQRRWSGDVDSRATANLFGAQAGLDLIRTEPYAGGHRDHAGVYIAHSQYTAPRVSGFALGTQNLRVGRLELQGPAIGAYWTHFGPTGWYLDAVVQTNWFDVKALSDYGALLNTNGRGWNASLEGGYPIRFGAEGAWHIEPQAQLLWQRVSLKPGADAYSTVSWKEGDEVSGRLGARLQYSVNAAGILWQVYTRANLWHSFGGSDLAFFGGSEPIRTRYGDTALEFGAGITARINRNVSLYAHADHRWSVGGSRSRESATQGSLGIRVNW